MAVQYAVSAGKVLIAAEYMRQVKDINEEMKQILEMMEDCKAKGEDATPLISLWNQFARFLAIGMVEGMKGLPQSARQVAMNLSIFENQKAVCLGELDYRSAGDGVGAVTPDSIYEIAVNGLPIPDLVSWEDILAFKADKANQHRLRAFHVWVSDVSKSDQTRAEITDRIEYLTQEYVNALNVARIKHCPGVLKCLVVGSAALVENIAKLKFKDIAEGAFKVAEAKGNLLEDERKAPGRELSYLVEAARAIR